MPFISKTAVNGQKLRLLIDTGTSKNYIQNLNFLKGIKNSKKSFIAKTLNGQNIISQYCKIKIFGKISKFYILPQLKTFDGIIGYDFLKENNITFDFTSEFLLYPDGKEKLYHHECKQVNTISIEKQYIPHEILPIFEKMITANQNAFADPNESLPFNTNVKATIKTKTEDPVYTRGYPYPTSATDFVNNEVKNLLKNGIIQKSYSPFNSPIHIVSKKGLDKNGKRNLRMVVDFRKLNENTTPDRYPIPDPSVILSNLGQNNFFSTLDLKSGYHQIELDEKDRQKTAFNINNGKFEFCRLPFGLRNAPSIFQRAIDDVLREFIGKICYVYIDDIIIFSKSEDQHIKDIEKILCTLKTAGMRISAEKSKFFRKEVEYLGFVVSDKGLKTSPEKVHDILNFQKPETLRALRSFLGMSGYYRRFIRDYALITKPLTKYLRGENGNVGHATSKKTKIELDAEALVAFDKVRKILASEDVLLSHPDFAKPFEITTDASSQAIGAVLSQGGRPLTMISRTLTKTEESYATNERELLAILWALKKLRSYVYGVKEIQIYTDHQPLIYCMSEKNPNTKMKRWKSQIEEYSPTFFYKPGKDNVVADALSRQHLNNIDDTASDSTIHSEISSTDIIKSIKYPVNQFRNQLIITKSNFSNNSSSKIFNKNTRHTINFHSITSLLDILKAIINPNVTNAIHCDLQTLGEIQNDVIRSFPGVKFIYSSKIVIDVINESDQLEIMNTEHNRAHRNLKENFQQIISEYYFPKIRTSLQTIISNCKICHENKYQRHPPRTEMGKTPIPENPGEILHLDIFSTDKLLFLTCVDKFSKFAIVQQIASRAIVDIKNAIAQILLTFPRTKIIVSDNEKSFCSNTVKNFLLNNYSITQFFIPTLHSTSNGQVERFHSTLMEIARCVRVQQNLSETVELVLLATHKYNSSIHSVTGEKPCDLFQNCPEDKIPDIIFKIKKAQKEMLERFNANCATKTYFPGDKVFLRLNKRLGTKFQKIFVEKVIEQDLGTTVLIDGKKIHKNNLR